ncbi:hypothetical protein E2320_003166 [Naja naja]|nr:hypothetical protein E2320_003166 [Naja naja]
MWAQMERGEMKGKGDQKRVMDGMLQNIQMKRNSANETWDRKRNARNQGFCVWKEEKEIFFPVRKGNAISLFFCSSHSSPTDKEPSHLKSKISSMVGALNPYSLFPKSNIYYKLQKYNVYNWKSLISSAQNVCVQEAKTGIFIIEFWRAKYEMSRGGNVKNERSV